MTEQPYGNLPLFRDLSADRIEDQEMTEIKSLCMQCEENGITRLMLTRIPFFKDVIIMSFECPHCGFKNNEIQPGNAIQEKGVRYSVELRTNEDMNRQVVKSDSASFFFPEIEFEIPANSQKGVLTTIEGLISRAVEGLEQQQPVRKIQHPEVAAQIDEFVQKLKRLKPPFKVILDDPTGNSFIENLKAPTADPDMIVHSYRRTEEQDESLGIQPAYYAAEPPEAANEDSVTTNKDSESVAVPQDEVLCFPVNCPECNSPTESRMKVINIPFFKEIILMAMNCEKCGAKSNEVKSGSGIEPKGKRITLRITDPADLNRDILKSETSKFYIPELEFEYSLTANAGKFTTIEGVIRDIKDEFNVIHPFMSGDSAPSERTKNVQNFKDKIDQVLDGRMNVTIILDDPAGNSYLQNIYAPEEDPEITIEEYERTEEQNDDLGLTHMNTENY